MKKLAAVLVLALVISGCGGKSAPRTVIVGDKLNDAVKVLTAAGAKDVSASVQIQAAEPAKTAWFQLKNGAWVCLTCQPDQAGQQVIAAIEISDKQPADKEQWLRDSRPVPQLQP